MKETTQTKTTYPLFGASHARDKHLDVLLPPTSLWWSCLDMLWCTKHTGSNTVRHRSRIKSTMDEPGETEVGHLYLQRLRRHHIVNVKPVARLVAAESALLLGFVKERNKTNDKESMARRSKIWSSESSSRRCGSSSFPRDSTAALLHSLNVNNNKNDNNNDDVDDNNNNNNQYLSPESDIPYSRAIWGSSRPLHGLNDHQNNASIPPYPGVSTATSVSPARTATGPSARL
jgi:hypothetical protein